MKLRTVLPLRTGQRIFSLCVVGLLAGPSGAQNTGTSSAPKIPTECPMRARLWTRADGLRLFCCQGPGDERQQPGNRRSVDHHVCRVCLPEPRENQELHDELLR